MAISGKRTNGSLRFALLYALVAGLYILLSDLLIARWIGGPWRLTALQIGKGLGFVAITGMLLYIVLRRHELRMEQYTRRYETAAENLPGGAVAVFDVDMRLILVGGHSLVDVGLDSEKMIGRVLREAVPADLVAQVEPLFREALEGRTAVGEITVGSRVFQMRSSPLQSSRGRVVTGVALAHDITERREAEEAALQQVRLRETLMDAIPAPVIHKNAEGRYMACNQAFASLMGMTREQIVGRGTADFIDLFTPETTELHLAYDRQLLAHPGSVMYEASQVDPKGRRRDFVIHKATYLDSQQQVAGIVGVMLDVTERKEIELQLRQAQKMEAVGRLAGGVAHDFRNQLTVIRGYADLLAAEKGLSEDIRQFLQEIRTAVDRSTRISEQLLTFSRKQALRPEVVDLNDLVQSASKALARMLGEDVELVHVAGEDLRPVRVDPGQFHQALVNLLINARDAMPGGGRVTIETANVDLPAQALKPEQPRGPCVQVRVTDTGSGMDREAMDRAFEPFFTTKPVGKGTGLGLPMVYGFVRQSGGDVDIRSERGRGTTFTMVLPISREGPPEPASRSEVEEPAGGTERILLVEDEASIRRVLALALRNYGYQVFDAGSPEEALEIARREDFGLDLLITDVIMPGTDGVALARQITERRPNLPTLFVSGYTGDVLADHGIRPDSVNLLIKPLNPSELARQVRKALDKR